MTADDASDRPIAHTPGPWSLLCDESRGRPRCLVVDAKGNEIAAVNPYREAWKQDAHLIAAVPKLLECLRDIMACGIRKLDDRIGYDELQIDRDTQAQAIELLKRFE